MMILNLKKDNRSFTDFFRQEGLIEVVRKWKKYPAGSNVQILPNGELWIANEMADVIISDSTKAVMKRIGIWDKNLTVGKHGYVLVGTNYTKAHVKMAESKRDSDFHNLLELGWEGQKSDLEVLHLDDCGIDNY